MNRLFAALVVTGLAACWSLKCYGHDPSSGTVERTGAPTVSPSGDVSEVLTAPVGREFQIRASAPLRAKGSQADGTAAEAGFAPADFSRLGPFTRAPTGIPGAIRVRVVRGMSPVAGAEVSAWRPSGGWTTGPPVGVQHRGVADADGFCTIEGVDVGYWAVGARSGSSFVSGRVKVGLPSEPARGVLLVFGEGTIVAEVRDEVGTCLADVEVAVNGIGPAPTRARFIRTDSQGIARFDGLVAGRYYVQSNAGGLEPQQFMTELEAGGERNVVFGHEAPPVVWSGRLIDGSGGVVELGVGLVLIHAVRRDERPFHVTDGAFEVNLAPGTWEVWRRGRKVHLRDRLAAVTIPPRALVRDIELPGTRVIVTMAGENPGAHLVLVPRDKKAPKEGIEPDRIVGQVAEFFMVPSGDYWLSAASSGRFTPSTAGVSDNGTRLEVALPTGQPVVRLDVEVL